MFFKTFCVVVCVTLWLTVTILSPAVTAVAAESPHGRFKRVIGGKPFDGRWPWIVRLEGKTKDHKFACSGVLIKKRWILTAGHCFRSSDKPEEWTATIGDPKVNIKYGVLHLGKEGFVKWSYVNTRKYEINRIEVHPNYHIHKLDNTYDIALVHLSGRHSHQDIYKKIIQPKERTLWPVPLPHLRQRVYKKGQTCIMIGFGCTKEEKDNEMGIEAHEIEVPIYPTWKCRKHYEPIPTRKPLCAGYRKQGIGLCDGDSGGPLVCKSRGRYTLAGIAIWSHPTKPDQFPAIFTRVQTCLPWIKSVIGKSQRRKSRHLGKSRSPCEFPYY